MASSFILKELLEKLDVSINSFEAAIKVGNSSIRKAIDRKSEIKEDTIEKIVRTYPNVSAEWLRTGEGKMFKEKKKKVVPNADMLPGATGRPIINARGNEYVDLGDGRYIMLVPMVDEYSYGGYLLGYKDPEYIEELPKHPIIVNNPHSGIYRTFVQKGDSMYNGEDDGIKEGDKVTGRSIDKSYWKNKLHLKRWREFIIVHKEGIITKEIIEHDVDGHTITIHSKNPDKDRYPDQVLSLEDVEELYNVIDVSKPRK